ncbi:uncharacterized protein BBOV_IV003960 [Babesia bovis T2Bo]|uniref:Uncharacterized protein n=1 Tax=Babesia bovis TaxID=5865 RepID=A7AQD8_BABBO|nr:uncharacterized protein BBOV_IV003960 [Babesia bovis T2Bo]EDO06757.1 hypothetical protein BBOV_IV003960 [Babesia bovis T2Bo]|eukprot:XP_001610325.1 hypothetical protein [Babesia bovis T2Bo]
MFRDWRSSCDISTAAVDSRFLYLCIKGSDSSIAVVDQSTKELIGVYKYMCGSVLKIFVLHNFEKLVCLTSAGYIYVWDASEATIDRLRQITNDPLTLEGFVHPNVRVRPVAEIVPASIEGYVDVDYYPGTDTLLALETSGNVIFHDIHNGSVKGVITSENADAKASCLRIQRSEGTYNGKSGHFVAIGFTKGMITLLFVPLCENGLEIGSNFTMSDSTDDHVDIDCIDFRVKQAASSSITIVCGCSDGTVRCLVYKRRDSDIVKHKSVSYVHCRAARKGRVSRIISTCDDQGTPYIITLCTMQLTYDFHTAPINANKPSPADSSTFCTEILRQILLPDRCEHYETIAQVRDFVTNLMEGVDTGTIMYTTLDDVYNIRRCPESNRWLTPKPVEWQSPENRKLLSKVL